MIKEIGTQKIETERLILRRMEITDAADMYKYWAADPLVSKFFTWEPHESQQTTEMLIQNWVADYANPYCFHWIIFCNECNHTIGTIYIDSINHNDSSGIVSCILSREQWGKGMATEATNAVVEFAFDEAGFSKLYAHHHENNLASGKALMKSGFNFYDKSYHEYDNPSINGVYHRYVIEK